MAWEHLSITKPHLVYLILGGFTSLFMLCSSVIKERLYIGEATVATICGIIFGPHAADLINPNTWGNVDLITLEFSRIVLVVQCFAVGVELPRAYMERHWKSVTMLLIPVMTFGWLITSLFIWWLFKDNLNWLDALCIAACVTATDPVLASSVVGKGKFAKRVPKHLRDLLSAESGCNDGMAFPFVYLAIYLIRYRPHADKVAFHWICYTILYECLFGTVYGVLIGYGARRAIRYAHERDLIDRESFLVFYFVLALFCAGSGSLLGMDDLLVGFAAGVGFSNDGWFLEKTEEAHVSNVIDLLINLAFFVYFGTIIPWEQFNSPAILGITPWKLVVLGILVLFFRRIPIMLALKPFIPDIKTWREASFAGHFGPIGVGGLFVAILARAELETESTTPLAVLPEEGFEHLNIIEMIWPITTFLVICSIIVHGSSIAVFTLGKRINTMQLTFSYTTAVEDGPNWMDRLPRIQSRSKSQASVRRGPDDTDASSMEEKMEYGPDRLPSRNFLRRQREEDDSSKTASVRGRRKRWDAGLGPGGPISQSAIAPARRQTFEEPSSRRDSETIATSGEPSQESSLQKEHRGVPEGEEIFQEGSHIIIEDKEGNVLKVLDGKGETDHEQVDEAIKEGKKLRHEKKVQGGVAQTEHEHDLSPSDLVPDQVPHVDDALAAASGWRGDFRKIVGNWRSRHDEDQHARESKRGAARAYQYGNTIIVEDEDGEVIKQYDIPETARPPHERRPTLGDPARTRQRIQRMGSILGVGPREVAAPEAGPSDAEAQPKEDDDKIRFTIAAGGRRMSTTEFIKQIQQLDPRARAEVVEDSNVPEAVKHEARMDAKEHEARGRRPTMPKSESFRNTKSAVPTASKDKAPVSKIEEQEEIPEFPFHTVSADLANYSLDQGGRETAAARRRRRASVGEDDEGSPSNVGSRQQQPAVVSHMEEGETAAERRRRLGALGLEESSDSDSENETGRHGLGMRQLPPERSRAERERREREVKAAAQREPVKSPGIRFAPDPRESVGGTSSAAQTEQAKPTGQTSSSSSGSAQRDSQGLKWGSDVKSGKK